MRILEAKLAMSADPDWLRTHAILGVAFGAEEGPQLPPQLPTGNGGEALTLSQIEAGLVHQLRERLQFIKQPDVIVGELLLNLADIVALGSSGIGHAQGLYEIAGKMSIPYSTTNRLAGDRLEQAMSANLTQASFYERTPTSWLVAYAVAGLLLLIFAWRIACPQR